MRITGMDRASSNTQKAMQRVGRQASAPSLALDGGGGWPHASRSCGGRLSAPAIIYLAQHEHTHLSPGIMPVLRSLGLVYRSAADWHAAVTYKREFVKPRGPVAASACTASASHWSTCACSRPPISTAC